MPSPTRFAHRLRARRPAQLCHPPHIQSHVACCRSHHRGSAPGVDRAAREPVLDPDVGKQPAGNRDVLERATQRRKPLGCAEHALAPDSLDRPALTGSLVVTRTAWPSASSASARRKPRSAPSTIRTLATRQSYGRRIWAPRPVGDRDARSRRAARLMATGNMCETPWERLDTTPRAPVRDRAESLTLLRLLVAVQRRRVLLPVVLSAREHNVCKHKCGDMSRAFFLWVALRLAPTRTPARALL